MVVKPTTSIRKDLRQESKSVHFKLDKETYTGLRIWCFQKGVDMNEIFIEFSKCLVEGDKRANAIIDSYILRSLGLPSVQRKVKSDKIVELSDEDKVSLYDLISGEGQEDNEFVQEDTGSSAED